MGRGHHVKVVIYSLLLSFKIALSESQLKQAQLFIPLKFTASGTDERLSPGLASHEVFDGDRNMLLLHIRCWDDLIAKSINVHLWL